MNKHNISKKRGIMKRGKQTRSTLIALVGMVTGLISMPPAHGNTIHQQAKDTIVSPSSKIIAEDASEDFREEEVPDTIAEYPGGGERLMEFLQREINYPDYPRKKEVVNATMYIDENGYVKDFFLSSNQDNRLTDECHRILRDMPRWQPAVQDGKSVICEYRHPILLTIDNSPGEEGRKKEGEITPLNETDAEFPGGTAELMKCLRIKGLPVYPRMNTTQKFVTVQFTIDEEGNVRYPQVVKGFEPSIDKLALETVGRLPKWKPATLRGKNIAVRKFVPLLVVLQ